MYKKDLFNRVSYYIHAAINGLKLQNITVSIYHILTGLLRQTQLSIGMKQRKQKNYEKTF